MKRGSTMVARGIVYLIGLAALSVLLILMPELAREEAAAHGGNPPVTWPFFVAAGSLMAPLFVALFQVLKLLSYIDSGKAFSHLSVKALGTIKLCAIVFSVMMVLAVAGMMIGARIYSPGEDTPGFGVIGFVFILASSIIATFAAVLQRLLSDAIAMKDENELTV
jgi:hypothetical protein